MKNDYEQKRFIITYKPILLNIFYGMLIFIL